MIDKLANQDLVTPHFMQDWKFDDSKTRQTYCTVSSLLRVCLHYRSIYAGSAQFNLVWSNASIYITLKQYYNYWLQEQNKCIVTTMCHHHDIQHIHISGNAQWLHSQSKELHTPATGLIWIDLGQLNLVAPSGLICLRSGWVYRSNRYNLVQSRWLV